MSRESMIWKRGRDARSEADMLRLCVGLRRRGDEPIETPREFVRAALSAIEESDDVDEVLVVVRPRQGEGLVVWRYRPTSLAAEVPSRFDEAIVLDALEIDESIERTGARPRRDDGRGRRAGSRRIERAIDLHPDVQVICTALPDAVAATPRSDLRNGLFCAMQSRTIAVAPLRERRDDIEPLAEYFASRHDGCVSDRAVILSPDLLWKLRNEPWPGNVLQLKQVIEDLCRRDGDGVITADDYTDLTGIGSAVCASVRITEAEGPLTFEHIHERIFRWGWRRWGPVTKDLAAGFGVHRSTILRWRKQFQVGLPVLGGGGLQ